MNQENEKTDQTSNSRANNAETKPCKLCLSIKVLAAFANDEKSKDGKSVYCKECMKAYAKKQYQKNRAIRLKQIKKWRVKNPELVKNYRNKSKNLEIPEKNPGNPEKPETMA